MSDTRAETSSCRLCGGDVDGDERFCSRGCREIHETLGEPPEDGTDERSADATGSSAPPDDAARAFFRIDGMYSALCEAYLESIAEKREGVLEASASYVSETVRVDYDPALTSADELRVTLTTTGYTAYRREGIAGGSAEDSGDDSSETTHRSREMTGLRKRRTDDVLEMRYVVGIVFGSFLLVPYVTILYPVYLADVVDWRFLAPYEGAFATLDGLILLPLFLSVTGAVLYLSGMPLLRGAYVSLKLRRPNTQLLAAVTVVAAFAYGTVSLALGRNDVYYDLTILVAATVMAALFYEATVKRRALARLTDLTVSDVGEARLLEADGTTRTVPTERLAADDRLLVREGERIPVDGRLAEGSCTVDEAVVTGESLPVAKRAGDDAVGGSLVVSGAAVVDAADRTESSLERLTETVWDLQSATHGVGRRADRLAARATPLVVLAMGGVGAAALALGWDAPTAVTAVLAAAIVASPWALGLAAPVSVATSIQEALDRGIVVFDETVFERLREVDVVVFDKTGTLTTGEMRVLEADAPPELLRAAGALEDRAAHPAATAIRDAFSHGNDAEDGEDGANAGETTVGDGAGVPPTVREFDSHETGVEGIVDGRRVLVGHPDLFRERGWTLEDELASRAAMARENGRLPVLVGADGRASGLVVVGDEPRSEWVESLTRIQETGVEVVVLTGDDTAASAFLERRADLEVFADVPPAGKTAAIDRLAADRRVAMVGDGTNDAPALAAADLGISLGGGTALAADAADLAILGDDLAGVERAISLARAAGDRATQNLWLALSYNAIAIPVALAGLLSPLMTAGAFAVTTSLVAANASRPLLDR
ncbi:heavy metal translocating P-type ATPase [Natronococcus amylolyticus DSM 10524]|uniref:Heavy metal translocating P-type ATPase n=1 Tax=Natronococcus amylolyticus DSM 10524 TaxID=1227497 RepID=L9XIP6_9EURY|nr:heavy metal translocating P-type ATPase [Natronococcus amylolyticus]ELY61482.1 heavy metal translocating P-type ATPase [Natronococcus amylolyticus DSM 10524]